MNTLQAAPPAVCIESVSACAQLSPDAAAVFASMRLSSSVRFVDLMDRTGLGRNRVRAALDELKRDGMVNAFAMGSRYSVRRPLRETAQ